MTPEFLKKVESWLGKWRSFLWGVITSVTIGLMYAWSVVVVVFKNWETLFGSIIGAFLPVVIAILWNPVANRIRRYDTLKESLREIEIDTTQIINDICDTRGYHFDFLKNIRDQVEDSKKDSNRGPILFNTPPKVHIYNNSKLLKYKTGSIYLHNSLIGLNKWIRQVNAVLDNVKESTDDIQKSFADRFQKLPHPAPRVDFDAVKNNYNEELLRFADELENLDETFDNGLEIVVTSKICGRRLNNWNRSFIYSIFLKHLDSDYKAFLSAEKKPTSELTIDMYESVQPLIKEDVDAMVKKIKTAMKA